MCARIGDNLEMEVLCTLDSEKCYTSPSLNTNEPP